MNERKNALNVWSSLGEMWGKKSIRVAENSGLGVMQQLVVNELISSGYKVDNRAPHIEIMKVKK